MNTENLAKVLKSCDNVVIVRGKMSKPTDSGYANIDFMGGSYNLKITFDVTSYIDQVSTFVIQGFSKSVLVGKFTNTVFIPRSLLAIL